MMQYSSSISVSKSYRKDSASRLLERLQQCLHERETMKEQQKRSVKVYSTIHYVDYLKRSIDENPLIGQVLFRLDHLIKNFSRQTNRFSSTLLSDDSNESQLSLVEKTSFGDLHSAHSGLDRQSNRSKQSLNVSPSILSNYSSPMKTISNGMSINKPSRPAAGLLTKGTQMAINKAPRQRTNRDIEVLQHLLNRCEYLRHAPIAVRRYAARSSLLVTYHPNTIMTRQHAPPFLVYMIVHGECRLLLETNRTTLFGRTLNVGDIYGEDAFQTSSTHRILGLITGEDHHCSFVVFFIRDIRAYENYLSVQMKQTLLDRLRVQSNFLNIQWREDLVDYFLKWSTYKQYLNDDVIYGHENHHHDHLYFILYGQVVFVRLLEFPSLLLRYPQFRRLYQIRDVSKNPTTVKNPSSSSVAIQIIDDESMSSSFHGSLNIAASPSSILPTRTHERDRGAAKQDRVWSRQNVDVTSTKWRFLEIFVLSEGHYFGFAEQTRHAWYLSRNLVDLISSLFRAGIRQTTSLIAMLLLPVPKARFQQLGLFAPMIFEKLREDFLRIAPTEQQIRDAYLNHLRLHSSTPDTAQVLPSSQSKKQINTDHYDAELLQKIHWIPDQTILSQFEHGIS